MDKSEGRAWSGDFPCIESESDLSNPGLACEHGSFTVRDDRDDKLLSTVTFISKLG